jgi:thioredoxin 2
MSATLQVVCPHCNAVNRLPALRLGEGGQCGKCHQALFTATPIELTAATIERHIARSDIPLVVDFWAPWCGPCRMMAPVFAQAAARLEPQVRFAKVNTEDQPALADRFAIRSIPTLAMFKGGRESARQSGALDLTRLTQWVQAHS